MDILFASSSSLLLLSVLLLAVTDGYRDYQTAIPNGDRVPHPCANGQAWLGVGHISPAGGGDRNPFGLDFAKHGLKWNRELCRADSDGDGRTNGEELGDPSCTWREGTTPSHLAGITHPGICEPVSSPACRKSNNWLKCPPGTFECDAFKDKGLRNMTVRLLPTPVPAEVTTYICMLFRVPDEVSLHLVAMQPLLNNTRVVHHMLLFGCRDGESLQESKEPYLCDMVPHSKCQDVMVTWTIGMQGDCLHQDTGFRLGKQGYTMVALQVHWNNPDRASHFTDSSGLVIHYTPNLRRYDAGILVFGHVYLQIDPVDEDEDKSSSSLQTYTSTCPQHCMKEMFNSTIYITSAINHMHYLGKTQLVELLRDGTKVQDIAWDPIFDYDNPVAHRLEPPVALQPGDEIRTTCTFRRPTSGSPVCYGKATSDEMCFGFLTYFPLQRSLSYPWCTSRRDLISCERTLPALWDRPIRGCAWRSFIRPPSPEALDIIGKVLGTCYWSQRLVCSPPCRTLLAQIRKHPCFTGDMGYYIVSKIRQHSRLGATFAAAWFSCNCDSDYDFCERRDADTGVVMGQNKEELCRRGRASGAGPATRATSPGSAALVALVAWLVTCVGHVSGAGSLGFPLS